MPNLTTKELAALEDQLGFEKALHCKYKGAAQETMEPELKRHFQEYADQHRQNYILLLDYLK
ncbi:MAG: spore coat protein [Oscillospiraceae bacterium]|nr:spore coat protein [Oscillospiraceae bacterium]